MWYFLAGMGAFAVLGIVVGAFLEKEVREGLASVALAAVAYPVILVAAVGLKLPKFTRKVTPESLRSALDEKGRWQSRTWAITSPRLALVLLRRDRRKDA